MAPEDVEAIRAVFQPDDAPGGEAEWLTVEGESLEADPTEVDEEESEEESEEEIARLQEEISASRRRQEVLQRYIEALEPARPPDPGS